MISPSPTGHPERSAAGAKSRNPEEYRKTSIVSDTHPPSGTGRFWIYILTNSRRTVLYTGITNSLDRRGWQHTSGAGSEFTRKYNATTLIYYENFSDPRDAIAREKQLKRWGRAKKEWLIASVNPEWRDLGAELFGDAAGSATGSLDCGAGAPSLGMTANGRSNG